MGLVVHRPQPSDGDVRIELRSGQRRVAKQLLDDPQIGSAFQQVCRGAVPQAVRTDVGRAVDGPDRLMNHGTRLTLAEPATASS